MKSGVLAPPQWSIKKVNRKDVKPFKGNPRTISPEDFEALQRSIEEHGYAIPLVLDYDLTIVSGHQRLKAIKASRINAVVPDRKLTEAEFQECVLRFNLVHSTWNKNYLRTHFDSDAVKEILGDAEARRIFMREYNEVAKDARFVKVTVGPYRFKIPSGTYQKWMGKHGKESKAELTKKIVSWFKAFA